MRKLVAATLSRLKIVIGWRLESTRVMLASLASIGFITFVCFRLIHSAPTTVAVLLLLVVLLTAISTSLSFAIITALCATLCLDFFFLPPIGSITVSDPQNWVSLMVFCAVSLIAGQLSNQLRSQRDVLLTQQKEAERLHALSRSLWMSGTGEDMRRLIVNGCIRLFDLEEFVLFEGLSATFYRSGTARSFPKESMRTETVQRMITVDGIEWTLVPVNLGNLRFGSMAYTCESPLPQTTIQSWASTVALGLAQVQAQEASSRAQAMRRSEELKSVMIDALAHDLKTPLTSIEAAADMLGESESLSLLQARDMISVIQEETRGLRRLVDEATHLARIDAKRLKLDLQKESVEDVVQSALQSLGEKVCGHKIINDVSPDLAPVMIDNELMVQALKQLLDNALKYGPPQSAVVVKGLEADGIVTISVRDSGPGLTELEQSRVFDRFYRGRYERSAIEGTGMGLSIAREIVEAHGGSVGVRSYVGQGTEFFIALKAICLPAVSSQESSV